VAEPTRRRWPVVVGALGTLAVVVGYALEAVRQRGSCDAGDPSPDTLALSVVLILWVGGLAGIAGIVGAVAGGRRAGAGAVVRSMAPAVVSLAGALSLLLFAGGGPATWFQHCGS
jgi:hypothetical protein